MSETLILEAKNLSKEFGGVIAVHNVSFAVTRGEIFAIIGPNGAGKTTLFNLISGVYTPTAGELRFDGHLLSHTRPHQRAARGLARTFQNLQLFTNMTALENVMMAQYFHSLVDEAEARSALERVGLGARLGNRPGELSGGEQQRVCIARAIINSPRLLLADEPTGNLDWKTGERVLRLVLDLHERKGLSSILVTHNEKIARYCHRVYMMEAGTMKLLESVPS